MLKSEAVKTIQDVISELNHENVITATDCYELALLESEEARLQKLFDIINDLWANAEFFNEWLAETAWAKSIA